MANSWKCPHCDTWIGAMQVHEDCARKQDEKRRNGDNLCGGCLIGFPRGTGIHTFREGCRFQKEVARQF
jgi:hypothetical protein